MVLPEFSSHEAPSGPAAVERGSSEPAATEQLASRLLRLEWLDELRQLVAKYALALDMRNMDALVALFPPDVRVGKGQQGRAALKQWFDDTLRYQFSGTAHVTGNHIIEFDDPSPANPPTARGVVYSRNEHECESEWVIMTMMYWDNYELVDGNWLFRRRLPLYWYATDLNQPPLGPAKMRWPGQEPYDGGWEQFWPSWERFWAAADGDVVAPVDLGAGEASLPEVDITRFLEYMRAGSAELPSVKVR